MSVTINHLMGDYKGDPHWFEIYPALFAKIILRGDRMAGFTLTGLRSGGGV